MNGNLFKIYHGSVNLLVSHVALCAGQVKQDFSEHYADIIAGSNVTKCLEELKRSVLLYALATYDENSIKNT